MRALAEPRKRPAGVAKENQRLSAELRRAREEVREALERQAATAEILKVIASSPHDVQPVFDAIARSAQKLFGAHSALVCRRVDDTLHLAAHTATTEAGDAVLRKLYPVKLTGQGAVGKAVLSGESGCIVDVETDPAYSAEFREGARARGHRSLLVAPMLREGSAIGAIAVTRTDPGPFSDHQVNLLETFADQAVIAIENVRLFNETREALERQTATGEILAAMSESMTDAQPVFDAIVRNLRRLFGTRFAVVQLLRGDGVVEMPALDGEEGFERLKERYPRPLDETTFGGRAMLGKHPIQYAPIVDNPEAPPATQDFAREFGFNSGIFAPMLLGDRVVGAIGAAHPGVQTFDEKQVALIKSFAAQAVIAIENVRLFNETKEALERQTATAEILRVISQSPTDTQPVFDAIAESARKLLSDAEVGIALIRGDRIELAAVAGLREERKEALRASFPRPLDLDSSVTRTVVHGETVHHPDTQADGLPAYTRDVSRAAGFAAMLGVPLLREGRSIGGVFISRTTPGAFSDKQIELLRTFADQAVIAIENVRLFNETKEALERQTATAEILKVIASSPNDTQPVFDIIAERAVKLCGSKDGLVLRFDGRLVQLAAQHNMNPEGAEAVRRVFPCDLNRNSAGVRAIRTSQIVEVADVTKVPDYYLSAVAEAGQVRRMLAVPLLREGRAIGAVSVGHSEPGHFSAEQVELLKTFADQAVIAIENVRLFKETKEALARQTATADVLRVISRSPSDVLPVFDAIVATAHTLLSCSRVVVLLRDGDHFDAVAAHDAAGASPPAERRPIPIDPAVNFPSRVFSERRVLHLPDWSVIELPAHEQRIHALTGTKSSLMVPLQRDAECFGVLAFQRSVPVAFGENEIALACSFADQAVIAIENVRLFNETKDALERQTATAEILNVISSSPRDLRPVFDAIVNSGLRLFPGAMITVARPDGEYVRAAAIGHEDATMIAGWRERFTMPLSRNWLHAAAIIDAKLIDVPDAEAEKDGPLGQGIRNFLLSGNRAITIMPMLRGESAIGAISVTRAVPGPLSDKQISLLRTFADQAVIAIENARLFKELETRTAALASSVDRLTALGEVGQAISSKLDLDEVLRAIVQRAVQLSGLDCGAIYEYDEAAEAYRLRAAEKMEPELVEAVRRTPIRKGDGATGRTAVTLEPAQVADVQDDSYRGSRRSVLVSTGYRAVLAVPLLREGRLLGALQVFRRAPGAFAPEVVELLQTFASQSALAIQNARLFREIEDKGRQLEVASKHKSQFLASMSHELRTPLNAILGFNEMLLGEIYGAVPPDMKEPLNDIQTSGKHLLRLINNVLDLAKIEAGRMELALSDYSLGDTVESVRTTLRPLAESKGLELVTAVPPDLPLVHGDPGRISQCLMNLAGNSLKFTKQGRVEIAVEQIDSKLLCRVVDTGIGIPPEKIGALFTEFKQTDATVASEYGGTGLGLSITKKFIEMHGGRIWVESEPGKGSTFLFELPVRAGAQA